MPLIVDRECGVNTTHGALGMWPGGSWEYLTVEGILSRKGNTLLYDEFRNGPSDSCLL